MMEQEINELPSAESDVPKRAGKGKKKRSFLWDVVEVVVIAIILSVAIKAFVVEMYWVPSASMEPTIMTGDHVVVTKFSYHLHEPEHNDIVVFVSPIEGNKNLIKRLIGVPGDIIEFKDSTLYRNGQAVDEAYLPDEVFTADFGPLTIPEDSYFMCGDNRQNSSDSRSWGLVDKSLLIGKGQVIYWPLGHISWL